MVKRWLNKPRRIWLALIVILSIFLDFFRLGQNGYGNLYYAAAIRSMLQSFHNFVFLSFDPGGFITVDKPPVGFWVQTLSAWIFGYRGWSILAPEALAGVVSVLLLYLIVSKVYGYLPGLIAAFLLAITPLSVATNRNNTIDSLLVVAVLAAAWALTRAMANNHRRLRWLLLASCFLGIGFNIKFAEAFVALPAFIVAYVTVRDLKVKTKVLHLFSAACVLAMVSLSWPVAVDAVPASERPFVGSTQVNSELNLAFGYDGVQRVTGQLGAGRHGFAGNLGGGSGLGNGNHPAGRRIGQHTNVSTADLQSPSNSAGQQAGNPQQYNEFRHNRSGFPSGGFWGRQQHGLLTLFTGDIGAQIGWWLPLAITLAVISLVGAWRRRTSSAPATLPSAILWTGWLATTVVYFTGVPALHTYYMVTMAPAIAAMVGIGAVEFFKVVQSRKARILVVTIALLAMALFQLQIVWPFGSLRTVFEGLIAACVVVAMASLYIRAEFPKQSSRALHSIAAAAVVCSMTVAPFYFAITNFMRPGNASDPVAGPTVSPQTMGFAPRFRSADQVGGPFGANGFETGKYSGRGTFQFHGAAGNTGEDTRPNPALLKFLVNHYQGGYLVATENANTAAPFIIQTGLPVMAIGGFRGTDPAISPAGLESLAQAGKLRYFLLPSQSFGASYKAGQTSFGSFGPTGQAARGVGISGMGSQQSVIRWIEQNCKPVTASLWSPASGKPSLKIYGTPSQGRFGAIWSGFGGFGEGQSLQLYQYLGTSAGK